MITNSAEGNEMKLFKFLTYFTLIALLLSFLDIASMNGLFPKRLWKAIIINSIEIQHDQGRAFWVKTDTGRFHSGEKPSIGIVLEDGVPLRSGNEVHDVIRMKGRGRYSFWSDGLYFSSSDNSSPIDNGRQYMVLVPFALPINWARGVYVLTVTSCVLLISLFFYSKEFSNWVSSEFSSRMNSVERLFLGKYLTYPARWVWINIMPGVSVTVLLLLVLYAAGEIYFRSTLPFNQPYWPSKFDERVGFTFSPGATVNWTNYLDYWTSTRVNSLGFLDREPPLPENTPDACRVVFIGDSMLEAAQVPIKEKMHIQFEQLANNSLSFIQPIETIAFGYAGSGQVNQLPFYDVFAEPLKPDVVVLIFVNNDFGNNSTTLESIRNGWHPLHPPRLFFEYDGRSNAFTSIPIDPDWQSYLLSPIPSVEPNVADSTSWLSKHSYFYNQLYNNFFVNSPKLSSFLTGTPSIPEIYRSRLAEIKSINGYAEDFGDWDPAAIGIDNMFLENDLPPAFEEAVLTTGYALDQFKERSERDNFELIILVNYGVSTLGGDNPNMYNRIKHLAEMRGIPLVDQYSYMISKGLGYSDVTFPHDAHMSFIGHQTSAEALLEYFRAHPNTCK